MKRVTATLTSKWQITLPKLVRDVMGLSTGDQMDFMVHTDGNIAIEKKKTDEKTDSIFNLVNLFLTTEFPLAIKGSVGMGKTRFATEFILKYYRDDVVGLLDPKKEIFGSLKEGMNDIILFESFNISTEELEEISVLVIEEAHLLRGNYSIVGKALNNDVRVIVIQQTFPSDEIQSLGDHFVISADKRELANVSKIEIVKFEEDKINFTYHPIYKA